MNNTRQHPRTMEQAFGPYHRSSYGIEPMPERDYPASWWAWMVAIAIVAVVLIVTTR